MRRDTLVAPLLLLVAALPAWAQDGLPPPQQKAPAPRTLGFDFTINDGKTATTFHVDGEKGPNHYTVVADGAKLFVKEGTLSAEQVATLDKLLAAARLQELPPYMVKNDLGGADEVEGVRPITMGGGETPTFLLVDSSDPAKKGVVVEGRMGGSFGRKYAAAGRLVACLDKVLAEVVADPKVKAMTHVTGKVTVGDDGTVRVGRTEIAGDTAALVRRLRETGALAADRELEVYGELLEGKLTAFANGVVAKAPGDSNARVLDVSKDGKAVKLQTRLPDWSLEEEWVAASGVELGAPSSTPGAASKVGR